MKRKNAFTLIELLVVVTIIAILAGLAVPAIGTALEAAKKAEATAVCTQLKTALSSYLTEYGAWQGVLNTEDPILSDNPVFVQLLLGESTEDPNPNPRQIVFMEFDDDSLVDRTDATQGFLDPWGFPYNVQVDHDYDNKIDAPGGSSQTVIRTNVIVWSDGKDEAFQSAKDPKSW